ncbi:MAG: B12-binding domain-containing radical SAM protein [Chitinispirillaceae bacterium]|nr:B12-binding domain-containing radical SAM protein [Chitinispirillaceae bacterium]
MKILLITPSVSPDRKTPDGLMIPQLALHMIEGLTPAAHSVKLIEEECEPVNIDEECDLVGISCMTSNAPRAYHLAQEFRKRGRKVVLGGVHPTILPDEAQAYADAVVVGEVEDVWDQLLADCENGGMKKRYELHPPTLDRFIPMKFRKSSQKRLFNVLPVLTTRGCPYNCEFCCVADLYGKKIRHAPIANVVRDIEESKGKTYIFLDDNIIGEPRYAKELFKAITPLKIKWVGQSSISFVHDTELMKLAVRSGCGALFFGLESVSVAQLKKMRKSIKSVEKMGEAVKKIKGMGIHFHASFVFGFDDDTVAVFPDTLEFLQKHKISTASFNILTPYPGTAVYRQFKAEGRLLTSDWKYYDHSTVVFKPKNMTPYELQSGEIWTKKEFSKLSSIIKYLPWNLSHPLLYAAMNLGTRANVKADMVRLPQLASELFTLKPDILPLVQPAVQAG